MTPNFVPFKTFSLTGLYTRSFLLPSRNQTLSSVRAYGLFLSEIKVETQGIQLQWGQKGQETNHFPDDLESFRWVGQGHEELQSEEEGKKFRD